MLNCVVKRMKHVHYKCVKLLWGGMVQYIAKIHMILGYNFDQCILTFYYKMALPNLAIWAQFKNLPSFTKKIQWEMKRYVAITYKAHS